MAYEFINPKYVKDYQTNENRAVKVTMNGRVRTIPMETTNDMYVSLMEQVDAGNVTIAPADPAPNGYTPPSEP